MSSSRFSYVLTTAAVMALFHSFHAFGDLRKLPEGFENDPWFKKVPIEQKNNCLVSQGSNPDGGLRILPRELAAVTDVWFHGVYDEAFGNRATNSSVVSYMTNAVSADDQFFDFSYRFLKRIQTIDDSFISENDPRLDWQEGAVPIEQKVDHSIDVFKVAMEITHNNPYWALKLISLYGHDDQHTELAKKNCKARNFSPECCRISVLNELAPPSYSVLYQPGALGGTKYTDAEVAQGKSIADHCSKYATTAVEKHLCNDNSSQYRADYYHVIASAFITCRREAEQPWNVRLIPSILEAHQTTLDYAQLTAAATYKLNRFKEELDIYPKNMITLGVKEPPEPDLIAVLREYLDRYRSHLMNERVWLQTEDSPKLDSFEKLKQAYPSLTAEKYKAALAITQRYSFEILFRQLQHRKGIEFGRKACKELRSLSCPQ